MSRQVKRVEVIGCRTTFSSDGIHRTEGYLELEVHFDGKEFPTPDEVADAWSAYMDEVGLTDD